MSSHHKNGHRVGQEEKPHMGAKHEIEHDTTRGAQPERAVRPSPASEPRKQRQLMAHGETKGGLRLPRRAVSRAIYGGFPTLRRFWPRHDGLTR